MTPLSRNIRTTNHIQSLIVIVHRYVCVKISTFCEKKSLRYHCTYQLLSYSFTLLLIAYSYIPYCTVRTLLSYEEIQAVVRVPKLPLSQITDRDGIWLT